MPRRRKFVSARLKEGEYDEKPWLTGKEDPNFKRKRWEKLIFWISIGVGIVLGAAICAFEYISVSTGTFCPIWEDNFAGIDNSAWSFEIQRGGFGTGSFDWTTDDPKNAYTDAEGLHIVPTLTTESTDITPAQLYDGYTLNLTTAKTCTSPDYTMCSIYSNKTTGAIINPVRSARMTTKGKKNIQYGKIEVVAKMPKGDWLWPAIWMMPEDSVYGPWPQSGEIDIAESRGNSPDNYTDGRNSIISALHWGPSPETDAFWRSSGKHNIRRTDYSEAFHTYGLEWTEDYLFMYIDSQLLVSGVLPAASRSMSLTHIAASLLYQVRCWPEDHVEPRRLWRVPDEQVRSLRPVVPNRHAQHSIRPEVLSGPRCCRRRYQRLLQGRRWEQAMG